MGCGRGGGRGRGRGPCRVGRSRYDPSVMPPPPAMDVAELQEFLEAGFPGDLPYRVEEVSDTGVRMRLVVDPVQRPARRDRLGSVA